MTTLHAPALAYPASIPTKRLLQAVIAIGGLAPVGAGLAGVLLGPAMAGRALPDASLDSHFSYLSGVLMAVGLAFWWTIPAIERRGVPVRLLTALVVLGGLGRLVSLWRVGPPGGAMLSAFGMELIVTPAICLWQWRLERWMDAAARRV
jgi:hypothetical protein